MGHVRRFSNIGCAFSTRFENHDRLYVALCLLTLLSGRFPAFTTQLHELTRNPPAPALDTKGRSLVVVKA